MIALLCFALPCKAKQSKGDQTGLRGMGRQTGGEGGSGGPAKQSMEDQTGLRGMGGQTGGKGSGRPAKQSMGDQTGLRGMGGQTEGGNLGDQPGLGCIARYLK